MKDSLQPSYKTLLTMDPFYYVANINKIFFRIQLIELN